MDLDRRPAALLILLSVLVHIGVPVAASLRTGRVDGYAFRSLDSREYYEIARNLIEHGTFGQDPSGTDGLVEPDTWRTPGYPLLLALVMILAGPSPVVLVIMQQVLSVLNVWLLFRITRRLMSERRATVAALLFLFEPYHLFYSLWLLAATWFTTLLLLIWYWWIQVLEQGRRGRPRYLAVIVLGVLSGVLVLVRPVGLLVPVVVFVGLLVGRFTGAGSRRLKPAAQVGTTMRALGRGAVFAATCLLVIGSWMLRNQVVAGHFALSDQSGVVLAYFKAAEVTLWREGRTVERYLETSLDPAYAQRPHAVWEGIDARLRSRFAGLADEQRSALHWRNLAQGNQTDIDSFAISKALARIGWSDLVESPTATAACCMVRCGSILTFPLNLAVKPPDGVPLRRWRSAAIGAIYSLLALAVLVRLCRGAIGFRAVYFPVACTLALLLAATPQVDPRFRVPMIPLLIAVALLPIRRVDAHPPEARGD
ncbi:MAG: glycosyltransferase family 39 protein [Planctomycetes bacterium]|nr:glycosyltransferase family 39 protein [Planctomycetota bacterium]